MLQNSQVTARKERIAARLHAVANRSFLRKMTNAYHSVHNFCYITGVQTMRLMQYMRKRVVRVLVPAGQTLYRVTDFLLLRHARRVGHAIASEARRFVGGFPMAVSRVKAAFSAGFGRGMGTLLQLPLLAVRRHSRALHVLGNYAAPVAALGVLMFTIQFWTHTTFALAVEYDGETLGYISQASVYDDAAAMATGRVNNTDNSFEVQRTPKLTIAMVSKTDILDEAEVCDKILESSSDSIAEVSGLYIDGQFEGSVQSRSELDTVLDSLLAQYRTGAANERVEFVQDVQVVDGLFPVSSVISADDMKAHLTAQTVVDKFYTVISGDSPLLIASKVKMTLAELRALNPDLDAKMYPDKVITIQRAQPYLRVQVVRTIEYTETLNYETKTVQDATKYQGYSTIRTKGVEGQQLVKAEVTLIDGVEQSRTILSTSVTKQPVTKVVVVGAKKVNSSIGAAGDGISTGRFIWPLPSCRMISSSFGYRWGSLHSGIDISGNGVYGKPVIAADGGTVAEVNASGYGGGYGKYIIIDHGGGYRTVYAHLSAVNVKAGMKVSKGQLIGKAGNSGNSYGAHLHFEVRVNGRAVNPVPYVQ